MIIKQDGTPLDLDDVFEVEGVKYTVHDIMGDTVIAWGKDNSKLRKRFQAEAIGMTADAASTDRSKVVLARIKLRDYWES
jgi:hypothetical protein